MIKSTHVRRFWGGLQETWKLRKLSTHKKRGSGNAGGLAKRMVALFKKPLMAAFSLVITAVIVLTAPSFAQADAPHIRFATGPVKGAYYAYGEKILQSLGGRIVPHNKPTAGSVDNINHLYKDHADFALVQQDVAADFLRQHPGSKLKVVRRAFYEFLHILRRKTLTVDSTAAFRGMQIWPGNPKSGSRFTANNALDTIGVSPSQYELVPKVASVSDLPQMFRDRKLDIAMLVSIPGDNLIRDGLLNETHVFYPLPPAILRALIEEETQEKYRGQAQIANIPKDSYPNLDEGVAAFTVAALIMTRDDVDESIIRHVYENAHKLWEEVQVERKLYSIVPVHQFNLAESGIPTVYPADLVGSGPLDWNLVVTMLVILAFIGLAFYKRAPFARWIRRNQFNAVTVAILGVITTATVSIFYFEHQGNEYFSSVTQSFWSIIVYIFSGLEDRSPHTPEGRAISVMVMAIAPVLIALATGWFASNMVVRLLERNVPKDLENHYLVLNWNESGKELISELTHESHGKTELAKHSVVILAENIDEVRKSFTQKQQERIHCHALDPTSPEVVDDLNIEKAQTIIVLAHGEEGERADERTIRIVFQLKRVADKLASAGNLPMGRPHVVAEVLHRANVQVLEHVSNDFRGELEVVAADRTAVRMVAQAALNPGLASVFSDLLSVSDSSELYLVQVPESAAGKSFTEYAATVISHSPGTPVLPLGVRRLVAGRHETQCNPQPKSQFATLKEGDQLVLLALNKPLSTDLPV
jgi:TRAP transporter TAXI family solute receptor